MKVDTTDDSRVLVTGGRVGCPRGAPLGQQRREKTHGKGEAKGLIFGKYGHSNGSSSLRMAVFYIMGHLGKAMANANHVGITKEASVSIS